MKLKVFHIVARSISYNLKNAVYQASIILLLAAVITGSLLTGKSVRKSLRQTSLEKLGNTGILISSGIRYFDPSLAERISSETGLKTTGLLELDGYCQHFSSGQTASRIKFTELQMISFHFRDIRGWWLIKVKLQ